MSEIVTKKFILHASGMAQAFRCGEQFRLCQIEGIKIPPAWAMVAGTGCHKAIQADLLEKVQVGTVLSVEAVQDAARDAVTHEAQEHEIQPEADGTPDAVARGDAVDRAVRLATLAHHEAVPWVNPLKRADGTPGIELMWKLVLPGYPVDFAGTIDVAEPEAVHDWKTAGKSPAADEADNSDQLSMYAYAFLGIFKKWPKAVILQKLVDTKTPKYVKLTSSRDDASMTPFMHRVEAVCEMLTKGCFPPADRGHWMCSPRFCGVFHRCKYVGKVQA